MGAMSGHPDATVTLLGEYPDICYPQHKTLGHLVPMRALSRPKVAVRQAIRGRVAGEQPAAEAIRGGCNGKWEQDRCVWKHRRGAGAGRYVTGYVMGIDFSGGILGTSPV